ncbi:nickel transporter permease [Carboxydothermus hydrogenoformans]|uniref:Oligopeptide/dipeptide ABC transporter, permease protein n=1 Tax=Carboxydothermus hydrogenoformans (strain ATCC BAA-161 / DSM 6008 / Z-2901) TaxID=246194 RepID=Q3AD08_CARHZ|nr:nickel transporter permease [Carboxydothermus hydrogenoformans]ABB15791.1 oligopeptide/dipeptide ABC transporter, permease protein [Carboxydothermus hydrogenoformans Z-2901]
MGKFWEKDWIKRLLQNKAAVVGLIIVLLLLFAAIFAPVLAPYDPIKDGSLQNRLKPPSSEHLLGTDKLGRDILSRIIFGARISVEIGVISVGLALIVGTLMGLIAGYYGGLLDSFLMRIVDIILAFPSILLAIAITSVLGPSLNNAMIAVGIVMVPSFARVVRSTVLSLKEMEFVEAARAIGATDFTILFRHILPNSMAPIIVQGTMNIGTAILDAAGLSFLGLGAQPPTPEWGAMLVDARELLVKAPWVAFFPGLAIMLNVLGFNLLGDGLRDALDPRLKQ